MSHCNLYYEPYGYSNFFRGMGLIVGSIIASNILTVCPKYNNKFSELFIIGVAFSFNYTLYLIVNNKYRNTFWNDLKNSFFITMCGSLVYYHNNYK